MVQALSVLSHCYDNNISILCLKRVLLVQGVAPFRGFLQRRRHQRLTLSKEHAETDDDAACGPCVLFFGCRDRNIDYIYKDDIESFAEDGTLVQLFTAFSREQEHKIYVQHRIQQHG